jgi:hypothetical protein
MGLASERRVIMFESLLYAAKFIQGKEREALGFPKEERYTLLFSICFEWIFWPLWADGCLVRMIWTSESARIWFYESR